MSGLYYVTPSPHIKDIRTTQTVMRDVIIALCPALIASVIFFSFRALVIVGISVVSCVAFEFLYNLIFKKKQSVTDLSAIVTGMLLGFNLPVSAPVWLPIIGAAFAILVVKMLYGGLGKNIVNPALAGRIFLFLSFSGFMTKWVPANTAVNHSASSLPLFSNVGADVVSTATPLQYLKNGDITISNHVSLPNAFLGNMPGCIGETSAVLLIIGGLYLLYKRVITWHIPVSMIGTVALVTFLLPTYDGISRLQFMSYHLLSGGLILGAIFMATDYATSPVTPKGRIIYGIGIGLITVFIRYFGGYPEGVSFAILLMNFFVWFIDKNTIPERFGGEKKYGKLISKLFKKSNS